MSRIDRLSALISRFSVRVEPADPKDANLIALEWRQSGMPSRVRFSPTGDVPDVHDVADEAIVFSARASLGGDANPLSAALPAQVELCLADDPDTTSLVQLLKVEARARRCGSGTVLDRLGEVLLVRLLRDLLEKGAAEPGLLGGLADPRLSRAIVAMHEHPGRSWRIEDLAEAAGLSVSRFAELFAATVGQTPVAYLRGWRMVLARQDIERGDRIQSVARRYGYGSGEALTRSFRRRFGENPVRLRRTLS